VSQGNGTAGVEKSLETKNIAQRKEGGPVRGNRVPPVTVGGGKPVAHQRKERREKGRSILSTPLVGGGEGSGEKKPGSLERTRESPYNGLGKKNGALVCKKDGGKPERGKFFSKDDGRH